MIHLHSFAADADLLLITQVLWKHKIPHRVLQVKGEQQLWLQDANQAEMALALCATVTTSSETEMTSIDTMTNFKTWFTLVPITSLVFLLVLFVALVTQLAESLSAVALFTFYPMLFDTEIYLITGFGHLWQQPWRLITPILLHFGWLHLVFNSLWWLDLGRRIELQSTWLLLALLVVTGLAGNLAQAWQAASLFGGLSGVIYGLLGYIWIIDRFSTPRYHLPQSILIFMLLWLLLGLSDVLVFVGFGSMANMAHLGGLLAGIFSGLLHLFWEKITGK